MTVRDLFSYAHYGNAMNIRLIDMEKREEIQGVIEEGCQNEFLPYLDKEVKDLELGWTENATLEDCEDIEDCSEYQCLSITV